MTTRSDDRPFEPAVDVRERFAAAALTGLTSRMMTTGMEDVIAREAWALAEAMVKATPPTPDK